MAKDKYPLEEESVKTTSMDSNYQASGNTIELVFKENRSFELHIGITMYKFLPHGSLRVPSTVIEHIDFQNVAKLFVIKK